MLKITSLVLFSLLTFGISTAEVSTEKPLCRESCTRKASSMNGEIEVTISAGGPFTSCEKAKEKACQKLDKILDELLTPKL